VKLEEKIAAELNRKYPEKIAFDWETFKKGC